MKKKIELKENILRKIIRKNKNKKNKKYKKKNKTEQLKPFIGRNFFYKDRNATKISDSNGVPYSLSVRNSAAYDSDILNSNINNLLMNTNSIRYKNNNRYKQYFLGDSAYDTKEIRDILKQKRLYAIIHQNIKNIKDKNKIIKFTNKEKKIYKNNLN
jgi:hypothetical protein